jgi:hypothetical protein
MRIDHFTVRNRLPDGSVDFPIQIESGYREWIEPWITFPNSANLIRKTLIMSILVVLG